MALDVVRFRKLVALDDSDALSRFALGQALFQEGGIEALHEAAEHLMFANAKAPAHLATYHVPGQVFSKLGAIVKPEMCCLRAAKKRRPLASAWITTSDQRWPNCWRHFEG